MMKSNSAIDFENEVIEFIKNSLSNGETIEDFVFESNKLTSHFFIDIYLPKGCKTLEINERTYIEIKYKFTYEAFEQVQLLSRSIEKGEKLLIITKDQGINLSFQGDTKSPNINVVSFHKLKSIATKNGLNPELFKGPKFHDPNSDKSHENVVGFYENSQQRDNRIIEEVKARFKEGNITLFLGAGVSASAKLPAWDSLLNGILSDTKQYPLTCDDYAPIEVASFNSAIINARILLSAFDNDPGREQIIVRKMHDVLYKDHQPGQSSELIDTIAQLCKLGDKKGPYIKSIITLNYDNLIEQSLEKENVQYQQIFGEARYKSGHLPIIHVHGVINENAPIPVIPVLSETEYHDLYRKSYCWSNIDILHALYRNTCIFIGLSMSDPNLRRLLEFVKQESPNNLNHFAILPYKSLSDFNWESASPKKYYKQDNIKDSHFRSRLEDIYSHLGVSVIWYENGKYGEIPKILARIAGLQDVTNVPTKKQD